MLISDGLEIKQESLVSSFIYVISFANSLRFTNSVLKFKDLRSNCLTGIALLSLKQEVKTMATNTIITIFLIYTLLFFEVLTSISNYVLDSFIFYLAYD